MSVASIAGNVVRDPFFKEEDGKTTFARFTIAEDTYFKGKTSPVYMDCIAFAGVAEVVKKHVNKGVFCIVEGRLTSGSYKKNNQTFYTRDIVVERIRAMKNFSDSYPYAERESDESDTYNEDINYDEPENTSGD
ncbi:MAG: single-stranded DNA-binding protein [Clostridiaceae bacterium]|jgi:single-stranded DNA-binding protein|nr:single-stranded DNA-binding protein [Clostridiaceae bacterium]